ncbi:MAG: 50S ribosomal protein L9 [Clostridia bacterium]|nr:50S ribosomal protein L9 [Clostridia bacterium]
MKILLLQDVKGTGRKGDIVEVNDGYAKNFLIKKNLAKQADSVVLREKASQVASQERTKQLEREAAVKKAENLKGKTFVIKAKVGDNGKLFGAITAKEIAEAVTNAGIEVDKKQIIMDTNIKNLGNYPIEAKLYSGVIARFNVVVE